VNPLLIATLGLAVAAALVFAVWRYRNGAQHDAADPALPRVPGYRLLGPLGVGRTGSVYLAKDDAGATRAVKLIVPDPLAASEGAPGFPFEQLSSVVHPNVATPVERGEAEGQAFVALTYAPGEGLDALLAKEQLSVPQAVAVARGLAAGLAALHEAGLVHGDVKAANVIISGEGGEIAPGDAKLIDFGSVTVARQLDEPGRENLERALAGALGEGSALFTAASTSPEQVAGAPLDGRSDVYSLGLLLYEMLAGRPAFEGRLDTIVYQQLHGEPEPLAQLNPEAPDSLVALVDEMLMKDRESRPFMSQIVERLRALE